MREIEFRAKNTKDVWVSGYLEREDLLYDQNYDCSFLIQLDTLGQYTGLKDKNGTKIFEGDIVKVDNKHIDIVVYANGCFCMDRQIMNYEFTYQDFKSIEVIGNIHDNHKLLEVDNA